MLDSVRFCSILFCPVLLYYVISCSIVLYYAILCSIMLYYVILCLIMLIYYVILCYIIFCVGRWALQDVLHRGVASAAGVVNRRHCTGCVDDRGIGK